MAFCGIDVSAATLAVAVLTEPPGGPAAEREFGNTSAGHKQLIQWLGRQAAKVRVSLEATGVYSLEVSLTLDRESASPIQDRPRRRCGFGRVQPEDDVRWHRPSAQALELRAITRHVAALREQRVRLLNQTHAASQGSAAPACVRRELRRSRRGSAARAIAICAGSCLCRPWRRRAGTLICGPSPWRCSNVTRPNSRP